MKNTIVLAVIACSILNGCGIPNPVNPSTQTEAFVSQPFAFQIPLETEKILRLKGINGEISITGSSTATAVMVRGEKQIGSARYEDSRAHIADISIRHSRLSDIIFVETEQPRNNNDFTFIVDYTITVPRNFEIQVENLNGDVLISSTDGKITVQNKDGSLGLSDINCSVFVELLNGNLSGDLTLPLDGTLDCHVANGKVDLRVPAKMSTLFIADVVNGSIHVSGLNLEPEVQTPQFLQGRCGEGRGMFAIRAVHGSIFVQGI